MGLSKRFDSECDPCRGGQPAQAAKDPCEYCKPIRPDTDQHEQPDRFGPFSQAPKVVDRLPSPPLSCESTLGSNSSECQERTSCPDKAEDQEGGREGEFWSADCEEEWYPSVEEEVECDIQIAAQVGRPEASGEGSVESIGQAICCDEGESDCVGFSRQGDPRSHSDQEADDSDRIRPESKTGEPRPESVERRVDPPADTGIKHRKPRLPNGSLD